MKDLDIKVINITPDNITEEGGVPCLRVVKPYDGIQKRIEWFRNRYKEGLRMKSIIKEKDEWIGFIEYVPGEYAWRTVDAKGYYFIHCLYVVTRPYTRHGYGSLLLQQCLDDSKESNGVAIITSNKPWLNSKTFFIKKGFKKIQKVPPDFELLVKQFKDAPLPKFISGWEERALKYGPGLSVIYTDQCPHIYNAIKIISDTAKEYKLSLNLYKLDSYIEAQNAPSPYGIFTLLYNGKFLTHEIIYKKEKLIYFLFQAKCI